MGAYVVRRVVFSLFVLWGAVTIIFVVLRLVPGDPAYIMLGPDADQAQVGALRAQLGLDHSLIQQYATYLVNVVHLDFGQSFRLDADSMSLVLQRLPATMQLVACAVTDWNPRADRPVRGSRMWQWRTPSTSMNRS